MKKITIGLLIFIMLIASLVSVYADDTQLTWDCTCGAKDNTGNFCPFCGSASPKWTCPDCNTENSFNFCTNCGKPKQVKQQPSETKAEYEYDEAKRRIEEIGTLKDALFLIEKDYFHSDFHDDAIEYAKSVYYPKAVELYDKNQYEEAGGIFALCDDYKAAEKYSTLCNARYESKRDKEFDITELTKFLLENEPWGRSNYDSVLEIIGFEDAKAVLINEFPLHFLRGTWKTQSGYYLTLKIDSDCEGFTVESNLPAEQLPGSNGKFENGYYIVSNESKTQMYFQISIQTKDAISVYCYKDMKTYLLRRQ